MTATELRTLPERRPTFATNQGGITSAILPNRRNVVLDIVKNIPKILHAGSPDYPVWPLQVRDNCFVDPAYATRNTRTCDVSITVIYGGLLANDEAQRNALTRTFDLHFDNNHGNPLLSVRAWIDFSFFF